MSPHTRELLRFICNLVFALYNCALGLASLSWWFIAVGAYYVILSIMRLGVIAFCAGNGKSEIYITRFSGVMLLALSVVLCGIVYLTVEQHGAVKYHEIAMITIALYAFTKLTLAVCGFTGPGKRRGPCAKTLQSITFTDSVVSIYSLQRSMLVSFPGMSPANIVLFNTLSGTGMCLIVICVGINLITRKEHKNG